MSTAVIVLGLLVTLAVLGVLTARQRRLGSGAVDPHTVRRLFQYLVLYGLVSVVAHGAAALIARPFGSDAVADDAYQLGQALGYVLVGLPLLILLAWWTRRQHRSDPTETASLVYAAYVTLTALVAAVLTTINAQELLAQALSMSRPDGAVLGRTAIWLAVWVVHWVLARRHLHDDRNTPHLLIGAAWGLLVGAIGLISTLATALDLLVRPQLAIGAATGAVTDAGALLLVGGAVWVRYWAHGASQLPRRTGWLAYVLLLGIAGGFITALVATSRLLWLILVWFFGSHPDQPAQHFSSVTSQIAAVLIGLVCWWYHRATLGTNQAAHREVRRVYHYVLTGLALVVAAVGIGSLVVALVESVTPGVEVGRTIINTWWAGLTAFAVSAPVWWVHWRQLSQQVAKHAVEEVNALPRRIYWVLLFGVAAVATVIALLSASLAIFGDLVAGELGPTTWRASATELGVLVAVAAVVAYHVTVFRADRAVTPVRVGVGPRSVLLIGATDHQLARTVRATTGADIQMWRRLDHRPRPWDETEVLTALAEHLDEDLVLIAEDTGLRVLVVDP